MVISHVKHIRWFVYRPLCGSPCSTNKGTLTFAPHANVAGLTAPVAVFPFTPFCNIHFIFNEIG